MWVILPTSQFFSMPQRYWVMSRTVNYLNCSVAEATRCLADCGTHIYQTMCVQLNEISFPLFNAKNEVKKDGISSKVMGRVHLGASVFGNNILVQPGYIKLANSETPVKSKSHTSFNFTPL
jgi:hypothetical protein